MTDLLHIGNDLVDASNVHGNSMAAALFRCYIAEWKQERKDAREDLVMMMMMMNYVLFYNVMLSFVLVGLQTTMKKNRKGKEGRIHFHLDGIALSSLLLFFFSSPLDSFLGRNERRREEKPTITIITSLYFPKGEKNCQGKKKKENEFEHRQINRNAHARTHIYTFRFLLNNVIK